ncbi:formate C-acetyltransferase [Alteromonas sp. ASW11-36]|uniref:Formate acetyltransferase n=1 Tax=Alteromonas arenosi TaxID=3055817 RepID=A0ABT7SUH7_9ALTE|nr:formate C-acetyltransferase [Alteromonas sp. ASW11-36]MDM7859815.1 formate C-acetyltransferase [Alteromonas sp. ASW11-36]
MGSNKTIQTTYWQGFRFNKWQDEIDVRDFIQQNYTPYSGDAAFLFGASDTTQRLWHKVSKWISEENRLHGPIDFDTEIPSTVTSHEPGYIDKSLEKIVGLQTEKPLKRALICQGGIRMVEESCRVYGKSISTSLSRFFREHRKTHNQGVFDVYTPAVRDCRRSGLITGLPDAYGRGRIIGDYRRVALYGIDRLIADKQAQWHSTEDAVYGCNSEHDLEQALRLREEIADQLRALHEIQAMASTYGFDISAPAQTAQQAIQWTYFAYLAAVKSQNGAAMSLGRVSSFFDIYITRDIANGVLTEEQAQEYIDHFVMKLRMVRFLRTPEYDQLFSGDPIWATESIGGMGQDGRTLVTKTSFRFLNTLNTMGASPEPNITVLWSPSLPEGFKRFCAKISIATSSIQYENDDLMREDFGSDDYAIACCVSPMIIGKQMQFFGARANLAKALLYAINGGVDEISFAQVSPKRSPLSSKPLCYNEVRERLDEVMDWLAHQYVTALNCIHYMHDKYSYEAVSMALHDRDVERTMAMGIAGLSICADSLSAIKYANVTPLFNAQGVATDFNIEGDFPTFGNNDQRVDSIASELVSEFMTKIRKFVTYRDARPTQSILTITSNVVYGHKTGNTPDGRIAGAPFAPGANPMHGRDTRGALASLSSVAQLPFSDAQDGISYTFSIVPTALGKTIEAQITNLLDLLDGYFYHDESQEGGQHLNVNVMDKAMLLDAVEHPDKYPQLTIRVSGYAVRFNALTPEQQQDVISRTFTESL